MRSPLGSMKRRGESRSHPLVRGLDDSSWTSPDAQEKADQQTVAADEAGARNGARR
jgi:hypothetical protein